MRPSPNYAAQQAAQRAREAAYRASQQRTQQAAQRTQQRVQQNHQAFIARSNQFARDRGFFLQQRKAQREKEALQTRRTVGARPLVLVRHLGVRQENRVRPAAPPTATTRKVQRDMKAATPSARESIADRPRSLLEVVAAPFMFAYKLVCWLFEVVVFLLQLAAIAALLILAILAGVCLGGVIVSFLG